jgi:hypothetical protein
LQCQRIRQPQLTDPTNQATTSPRRRAQELPRDKKIEARALRNYAKRSYQAIAQALGATRGRYSGPVTGQSLRKSPGMWVDFR